MRLLLPTGRIIALMLACFIPWHGALAAPATNAVTTPDPAFAAGLATLKAMDGFIQDVPGQATIEWRPNLRLWVGVKAIESSKRTNIHFVQLTTLPTPTNVPSWKPALRTNHWDWSPSNKAQFVSTLYPVRVQVFDATGQPLKQGQTPMAWGMVTNGLLDLCRLSFATFGGKSNSPAAKAKARKPDPGTSTNAPAPPDNDLMLATGGGFLWMFGMFQDLQTVPTVADVWESAQCAIRWPSAWTIMTIPFRGITLELFARSDQVTRVDVTRVGQTGPLYCLPVDLQSGKRKLARVEIVVGPAHGAEMLLAGIRSIRARHPTKPKQEFLTEVLAAGTVREAKEPDPSAGDEP